MRQPRPRSRRRWVIAGGIALGVFITILIQPAMMGYLSGSIAGISFAAAYKVVEWVLGVEGLSLVLMVAAIGYVGWRLWRRWRHRKPGDMR